MMSKYGMDDCKPIAVPLDQNGKIIANIGVVLEAPTMYQKMVGSLIYATVSKPNLSYLVGFVSQFMEVPRKPHLDCMQWIIWYLSATTFYALFYAANTPLELYGYTDIDWVGSEHDRRSNKGYMFSFGSVVAWSSKKQPIIAQSSTEGEQRSCRGGCM